MSRSRFPVAGRLDKAAGVWRGTVEIDRTASLFRVWRLHSRDKFEYPLAAVADMVCLRGVRARVFQKRLERAAKRKLRRG